MGQKAFRNDPTSRDEGRVEVSDQGVKLTTYQKGVLIEWRYFYSIKELKNFFILYLSTSNALIIPKRRLRSKQDIHLFKNIFLNNMEENQVSFKNSR